MEIELQYLMQTARKIYNNITSCSVTFNPVCKNSTSANIFYACRAILTLVTCLVNACPLHHPLERIMTIYIQVLEKAFHKNAKTCRAGFHKKTTKQDGTHMTIRSQITIPTSIFPTTHTIIPYSLFWNGCVYTCCCE